MSLAVQAGIFAAGITVGALAAVSTSKAASSNSSSTAPSSQTPSTGSSVSPYSNGTPPSIGSDTRRYASTAVEYSLASDVLKYGFPGPVADLLRRKAYIAAYDRQKRHPAWTAEHLTAASLRRAPATTTTTALPPTAAGSSSSSYAEALVKQQEERQQIPRGDRANSVFAEDVEIPERFKAKLEDYFRSGYDRGHMVPAADAKQSQEAMDETFLLTNIAPQVGDGFNRHYWAYVEDFCRRLTGSFSDVYVFTVPLYLPKRDIDGKWRVSYEVIGAQAAGGVPNIAVPTHFAKVVLAAKSGSPANPNNLETSLGAFVLPNAVIPDETPFEMFKVPVEAVEKAAGLNLFNDATKASSRDLCRTVKCEVIVRRFDDARKQIPAGTGTNPRERRPSLSARQ